MATTAVLLSTTALQNTSVSPRSMASRRAPLAVIPNAVNSPLRAQHQHGSAVKRTRAQVGDTRDQLQEQPPAKKQAIELKRYDDTENIDPIQRRLGAGESHDLSQRSATSIVHPTAFEKRLIASRDNRPAAPTENRAERAPQHQQQQQQSQYSIKLKGDDLESLRQWQRHYRKQFPSFVFYFDNVASDICSRLSRQVQSLGAKEEKFFSKAVTHVVTTRPLPSPVDKPTRDGAQILPSRMQSADCSIAPALLDSRKTADMLDSMLQRRAHGSIDSRWLPPVQAQDVLVRARDLDIKIWTLEKLQRVLNSMLEADFGSHSVTHSVRQQSTSLSQQSMNARQLMRTAKEANLQQLLRNEKINGPADRDITVAPQDMCAFKGLYIYIHDMDEKTKPVMLRDYPKPSNKDEGKWPQFHMSNIGRCPFLEDASYAKQQEEAQLRKQKSQQAIAQKSSRTANATSTIPHAQPLTERDANLRRSPRKQTQISTNALAKPLEPPRLAPTKRRESSISEAPAVFGSTQINLRGLPRMIGGVAIASGMQQSNVTSAIRSQIVSSAAISSTAPGMNRRLTDSKEVSVLKRKVLERGTSANSQPPSSYLNDMRAAINEEPQAPPPRAAKRKAQENILGAVPEDEESGLVSKKRKCAPKAAKAERDPKPGYCENCRDKFDDFEEHCNTRKHQKFARTMDNWRDLDDLLLLLKRPHKTH